VAWGPSLQSDDSPEAARLRAAGASWDWVALGFADWPFWDLHVGVLQEDHGLRVGLHWRRDVDDIIRPLATELLPMSESRFSDAADEHQREVAAPEGDRPAATTALELARHLLARLSTTPAGR
jgi:hypothetical protein